MGLYPGAMVTAPLTDLVELPGGTVTLGSADFYPEETPVHTVSVGPLAVDVAWGQRDEQWRMSFSLAVPF